MDHETRLGPTLVTRVRAVAYALREVDANTDTEWIERFALDHDPRRQIAIWEVMALAYSSCVITQELSAEARQEVYSVIVLKSLGETEAHIIEHPGNLLDESDRREILEQFQAAAHTLRAMAESVQEAE